MYQNEVEAYKKFRSERLVPERNLIRKRIEDLELEIKNYERLKDQSNILEKGNSTDPNPVKIPLDLGAGYSADFEVYDKDFVLVSVGFGFYCQMTWDEAGRFCSSKLELLRRRRIGFAGKLAKINEHLKLTDEIITQLSK